MGFGDFATDFGNWLGKNQDNIATVAKVATPIIHGFGAYGQYQTAKDANEISMDTYKYNKSINDREIAKENMSQANRISGFNSVFGDSEKKKKKLGSYAGMTNYEG